MFGEQPNARFALIGEFAGIERTRFAPKSPPFDEEQSIACQGVEAVVEQPPVSLMCVRRCRGERTFTGTTEHASHSYARPPPCRSDLGGSR